MFSQFFINRSTGALAICRDFRKKSCRQRKINTFCTIYTGTRNKKTFVHFSPLLFFSLQSLIFLTKTADILVSAVGEKLIEDNMVKFNGVVVDVGIFKDETGKTRGDVDFANVSKKTSFISPVPGGVGPMTIASLMLNTVELFDLQNQKKS